MSGESADVGAGFFVGAVASAVVDFKASASCGLSSRSKSMAV